MNENKLEHLSAALTIVKIIENLREELKSHLVSAGGQLATVTHLATWTTPIDEMHRNIDAAISELNP